MDTVQPRSVEQICDTIGRRQIAAAVGVGVTSVSNAVVDGRLPARWFHIVDGLCAAKGLPCPRNLFSFAGIEAEAVAPPQTSGDAA